MRSAYLSWDSFSSAANPLDRMDEALVKVLERKAGLSSRSLSKLVGLPISTVHRRVKKMEREGIIKGYKAIIDYEETTRPIGALLLDNLEEVVPGKGHIPKKDVVESFRKFEEISSAIITEETVMPPPIFIGRSLQS